MSTKPMPAALMAAVAVACTAASQGAIVLIGSTADSAEQTGANFIAEMSYNFVSGNQGTLSVMLTNTSEASMGGALTAFVFNVGSTDPAASATLISASRPAMSDAAGASASPFGGFYIGGAGTGGQFEGGGSPNGGIAPGSTGSFTFSIVAADAAALTHASFHQGPYDFNFVVRFRGLNQGAGSDKVPGVLIPGPGAIAMLGMFGVATAVRRRR